VNALSPGITKEISSGGSIVYSPVRTEGWIEALSFKNYVNVFLVETFELLRCSRLKLGTGDLNAIFPLIYICVRSMP